MSFVPLIAAAVMFSVAFISIRHPDRVRSWMREESPGIAPARLRESGIDVAPVIFAIGSTLIGLGALAAFVKQFLQSFIV